jgi:hypothetical protein
MSDEKPRRPRAITPPIGLDVSVLEEVDQELAARPQVAPNPELAEQFHRLDELRDAPFGRDDQGKALPRPDAKRSQGDGPTGRAKHITGPVVIPVVRRPAELIAPAAVVIQQHVTSVQPLLQRRPADLEVAAAAAVIIAPEPREPESKSKWAAAPPPSEAPAQTDLPSSHCPAPTPALPLVSPTRSRDVVTPKPKRSARVLDDDDATIPMQVAGVPDRRRGTRAVVGAIVLAFVAMILFVAFRGKEPRPPSLPGPSTSTSSQVLAPSSPATTPTPTVAATVAVSSSANSSANTPPPPMTASVSAPPPPVLQGPTAPRPTAQPAPAPDSSPTVTATVIPPPPSTTAKPVVNPPPTSSGNGHHPIFQREPPQ